MSAAHSPATAPSASSATPPAASRPLALASGTRALDRVAGAAPRHGHDQDDEHRAGQQRRSATRSSVHSASSAASAASSAPQASTGDRVPHRIASSRRSSSGA